MVKKDTERRILKINHNRFNSLAKLDPPQDTFPVLSVRKCLKQSRLAKNKHA